jgi:RNA polymerase sigma-70 factor (sigma-E family)
MHGGDRQEFVVYVTDMRNRMVHAAYRLCNDWYEAEDLTQITLLNLFRRWELVSDRDHLAAYASKALIHTYISQSRPRWRRHEISRETVPESDWLAPSPEDRMTLVAAVAELSPRQRAVVVCRFWGGLSVTETATRLGCSAGAVTSHMHRALTTLRAKLDAWT